MFKCLDCGRVFNDMDCWLDDGEKTYGCKCGGQNVIALREGDCYFVNINELQRWFNNYCKQYCDNDFKDCDICKENFKKYLAGRRKNEQADERS